MYGLVTTRLGAEAVKCDSSIFLGVVSSPVGFPQMRTARRHPRPSPLFRWYLDKQGPSVPGNALVFGAGFLLEAQLLAHTGWSVDVIETPNAVARRPLLYDTFNAQPRCRVRTDLADVRKHYRLVVATHVLEFVECPSERTQALKELAARLAGEGDLLLSLRGWNDVYASKRRRPYGDGIVTGLGTWTRGFSREEAQHLVHQCGLVVHASPQGPRSRTPEQVRLVCRLG